MANLDQKSDQKSAEIDKKSDNIVLNNVSETEEELAPEAGKETAKEAFVEKKLEQKVAPAKVENIIETNSKVLAGDELSEKTLPKIEQKEQFDNIPELKKAESMTEEKNINIKKDLHDLEIKKKLVPEDIKNKTIETKTFLKGEAPEIDEGSGKKNIKPKETVDIKEKKNELLAPRVIIKEKIVKEELSEQELESLFKKRLLEYLKNARQKKRIIYENNLKWIEKGIGAKKFTPRGVASELKISQRTASRYLSRLFKKGKIMRFGKGRKVYYQTYLK